jgi:hypothetical protein
MTDDEISGALHDLSKLDMTAAATTRARGASAAAFEVAHGRSSVPGMGHGLLRFAVPLGLVAVVVIYLQWAVSAATALAQ